MKLRVSTDTALIVGMALLLSSIVVIILFSISQSRQVNNTAKWISHTHEVIFSSEKVLSGVIDNETGSRGYIITGQHDYLEPMLQSQKEIYTHIGQLRSLVSDNPRQLGIIDSLQYYADKRIVFSNRTTYARQAIGIDSALALVETGEGKIYTDKIRELTDTIQVNEQQLLQERKALNEQVIIRQYRILLAILVAVSLLVGIFIQKVRVDVARRKAASLELEKMNAELERKVEERTADLVQARNLLSETFERITDAFIAMDPEWRFTYINKKAGEIMNCDPALMIGKNIWAEFPKSVGGSFYQAYHEALETQQYIYLEEWSTTNDKWYEVHIYPSPKGISVFLCDITEKKISENKLKASEEKYRVLVERISDSFIALDKNWNYTYLNKKAGELIRRDPDELIGKNVWEVFPDAVGSGTYDSFHKAMEQQEYLYNEDYYEPLDLWQENHIYPSSNGLSIFIRDITEKKRAEAKVIKLNRLYHFISQVNQMIVRTTDEETLFREAGRIAIEYGDFQMAWIGLVDKEGKELVPVMFSGEEGSFLASIQPFYLQEPPSRDYAACRAANTGENFICNDIENGPFPDNWKKETSDRNYRSCMSLPIKKFNKVAGVFTFFASVKNFFDDAEVALLVEATGDVSFALEIMENERLRKKAETELLDKEKKFRALIENSSDGLSILGADGSLRDISPSAARILGYKEEELIGRVHLSKIHPDDLEQVLQAFATAINNPSDIITIEYRHRMPDGQHKWLECSFRNLLSEPYLKGIVLNYHDITERKNAELKILENSQKYRRAQEIGKMGHWELDIRNNSLSWSDEIYRIFDTDRNEVGNQYDIFFNALHPDDRTAFAKALEDALLGKRPLDFIHRIIIRGDIILYVHEMAELVRDEKGNPVFLTGTVQDITDLIRAQDEIIKEKDLSESIVNSLPGIFYLYDLDGHFLRWNNNFETVSEYTAEEISGMHPLDFFDAEEKELLTEKISNVFITGEDNVQANFLTKSGEKIPYYFTGIAIEYENGKCLMGVGIDFSERVKAQEIIRQSSEQLRQLTAHLQEVREEERKRIGREIHDELGQQLTAIKMDIAWINRRIPDDAKQVKDKLGNTMKLLDSGNQSIRRILNELRPVILDDYGLLEALGWQGRQFTANTGIPVELATSETQLKLPEAIATCIFRVYQEALTNITRYAEAKQVNTSLAIMNDYLQLIVEDDGKGFDTEMAKQKNSFGILGMKERVLSVKGDFELSSTPGKGTRISVGIPIGSGVVGTDHRL